MLEVKATKMKSPNALHMHRSLFATQDLIAHDNKLDSFPSTVLGCAALNLCDLRNNELMSVPCELGSLVTIRNLRLEGLGPSAPIYQGFDQASQNRWRVLN